MTTARAADDGEHDVGGSRWRGRFDGRRRPPLFVLIPIAMMLIRLAMARRFARRQPLMQLNVNLHPSATIAISLLRSATVITGVRRRGLPWRRR